MPFPKKDGTTMIERRKELPLERQTVTNLPVHRSRGWCTSLFSEGGEMLGTSNPTQGGLAALAFFSASLKVRWTLRNTLGLVRKNFIELNFFS